MRLVCGCIQSVMKKGVLLCNILSLLQHFLTNLHIQLCNTVSAKLVSWGSSGKKWSKFFIMKFCLSFIVFS